jgi:hypothetical protein
LNKARRLPERALYLVVQLSAALLAKASPAELTRGSAVVGRRE